MKLSSLFFALLLSASASASAQTTSLFMPEGAKDLNLGATLLNIPRAEGSQERRSILIPTASVQWSNGAYLEMNELGMNFSPQPNVRFGPYITPSFSTVREAQADGTNKDKLKFTPEAGAFYNYRVAHNISANANLNYGSGNDRKGLVANFSLSFTTPIIAHHFLGVYTGFTLANQNFMQSQFGISDERAAADGLKAYHPNAGVKNLFVGSNWTWEFAHKYSLTTGVSLKHYVGDAAASPWVNHRADVNFYSALNYHY